MLFVDLSLRPPEVSHPLSSINFVTHGLCHAGGNTYIKAWRSAITRGKRADSQRVSNIANLEPASDQVYYSVSKPAAGPEKSPDRERWGSLKLTRYLSTM